MYKGIGWAPKATKSPTTLEIAWAAGIFEGEGCCGWTSKKHECQEVIVLQSDRWILDKFTGLFGGVVYESKSPNEFSKKPMYRWKISGARARGFLMTIYLFLSPRRREQVKACGVFA